MVEIFTKLEKSQKNGPDNQLFIEKDLEDSSLGYNYAIIANPNIAFK